MLKRKIIVSAIFGIIVFCSIIYLLPNAYAIDYTVSDAENDVLRDCATSEDTGDYHDEIDIVELNVTGQYVNITVAGNLANWNSSYFGSIYFSPRFTASEFNDLLWTTPYYIIDFENESGPIEAFLERGYSLGGNNFAYEVWNGTGWEDRNTGTAVNILYAITSHSVVSYIPDGVEEIPSSMKVVAKTRILIFSSCNYSDITSIPSSGGGVPSYNLFIIICTMVGISLIILKKHKK